MHLRSISMKGFKSFPHRTKLDFSPGVGVVVGPNGSGKSNITDAVLWALGEQSPLAVRGQSMKDVIFAGGHGVKGSSSAEVEVVIDNQREGGADFSEISIVRKLDRNGDGEYRLNGARCRLADVVEVLSDTGLGKEMHSVVSQGRVEAIVLSKPRDRRLLIEEAAGLGKHRKRRRRAQLKLERTEENLSRALDVEREARSRLRPLKRQAEAAQLHERLQRQSDEARYELSRDTVRQVRAALAAAEEQAAGARRVRTQAEGALAEVARRREAAESALTEMSRRREELQGRLFAARSAHDRIGIRLERARDQAAAAADGAERRRAQLVILERELAQDGEPGAQAAQRVADLERELAALEGAREERVHEELGELEAELARAEGRREQLEAAAGRARGVLADAERAADRVRRERREAEKAAEAARGATARAGADLAVVNQFLRTAGGAGGAARPLSDGLEVDAGFEAALAAALGPRLQAGVVESLAGGREALDGAGQDGGMVIVGGGAAPAAAPADAPCPGARRLLDHVRPSAEATAVAGRLLADVWVVGSVEEVDPSFSGSAVTLEGRVWRPARGELRQAPTGGAERVLEQRNRRAELVERSEAAVRAEAGARAALEAVGARVAEADSAREVADSALRAATRELESALESARHVRWLMQRRREAPDEGPDAVRRAELSAEVRAERRVAEGAVREREERVARAARLRHRIGHDDGVAQAAGRAGEALALARDAVAGSVGALEREGSVSADQGERTAAALRECAHEEAELQAKLRAAGERVTDAEVAAQRARDGAGDAESTLAEVAGRLGLDAEPAEEALAEDRRGELEAQIERLARRREQLGPVNPLAAQEYEEAVAHVEELEVQRTDLEGAMAELAGLIRDTDRRIRESFEETFEAAARNFEEVVGHLFPGGSGKLRLVAPDQGPRPVLGGEEVPEDGAEPDADVDEQPAAAEPGVEVEVTPAGKSSKRLSLLSGGEKSLVALAFMFAVFLARPCPFYILDEVEAALDDLNVDRFLQLVRRYSDRAQFIVVTHQKRTMDAADRLYGVSMGGDGVSRVVSRKLAGAPLAEVAQPPRADVA